MTKPISVSAKVMIALVVAYAGVAAINVYLPQGAPFAGVPGQQLPVAKPVMAVTIAFAVLVIYGVLAAIGLKLAQKMHFAEVWDTRVSNRQRFLVPAVIGGGCGLFFIVADLIFSSFNSFGPLPHPPFPTSLVGALAAGIGEEILFRLFFVSFWLWLISYIILRKRWQKEVFWLVTVLSAIAFAIGHLPGVMVLFGIKSIGQIPPVLLGELFLLNGLVSVFSAYCLRRFGFLAAAGVHFWTDIVWHVIWGLV